MTFHARMTGGSPEELTGAFNVTIDGETYSFPTGAAARLTDAELAAHGIMEGVEAGPEPADVRVLGRALAMVDGVPTRVWQTVAWSADEARGIVRERINALRDQHAEGGAPTPFGRADSDAESRLRVSGAVQLADKAVAAGEPFAIAWTMADDTMAQLDANGMGALGIAVGQHYAACWTHAQLLKTQIATAADPFAIDIEAGWPA